MNLEIDLILKLIGTLAALFGIFYTIYKGWHLHDQRLIQHDEKINVNSKDIDEMKNSFEARLEKLEEKLDSSVKELNGKIDKFMDSNAQLHQKILDEQMRQGNLISEITGYIRGVQK